MMLLADITLLLLAISFKHDGNGAFGENTQNLQKIFH